MKPKKKQKTIKDKVKKHPTTKSLIVPSGLLPDCIQQILDLTKKKTEVNG